MDFILGSRHYVVEAKQCWPRLGVRNARSRVEKSLVAAQADVRRADAGRHDVRLAVVFAAPGSMRPQCIDAQVAQWVDAVRGLHGCARAWVFPQVGRHPHWQRTGRHYPGAAIFVQRARR